jgi:hypothetical protein
MGCDYQGYEFGAGSYPDSVCVDGFLFDADNCDGNCNLYEPIEEIPCPICQRAAAIEWWTGRNQCSGISRKAAEKAARSLVRDIRQRRGLIR